MKTHNSSLDDWNLVTKNSIINVKLAYLSLNHVSNWNKINDQFCIMVKTVPSYIELEGKFDIAKFGAIHLIFSVVITHLNALHFHIQKFHPAEAGILLRSLIEAIDLTMFFSYRKTQIKYLRDWFLGRKVPPWVIRKSLSHFWIDDSFKVAADKESLSSMRGFKNDKYAFGSWHVHHRLPSLVSSYVRLCGLPDQEHLAFLIEDFNQEMLRTNYLFRFYFQIFLERKDQLALEESFKLMQKFFLLKDFSGRVAKELCATIKR